MKLSWQFPLTELINLTQFKVISTETMRIYDCEKDEIIFLENCTIGSPSAFTLTRFISPIMLSIYDIRMTYNIEENFIKLNFNFYKLFIILLIFPIISVFMQVFWAGLITYLFSIVLFGSLSLFQLYINKGKVEKLIEHSQIINK